MPLKTASYNAVQRDLTIGFRNTLKEAQPIYPRLCEIRESNGADEKYGWLGDLPGMREWVGDRQFNQLAAADYTLKNKTWEASLEFEKEHVEDDRLNQIYQGMSGMAAEAAYFPDELLFSTIINEAESRLGFDDQYFFDTDHQWGDSGTQSNLVTYNATDHTNVTPAEFRAAFNAGLIRMLGFKNDRGKPMYSRPSVEKLDNFTVTVPLSLYEVALKAFEQEKLANGEENFLVEKPQVIMAQYLGASHGGSDSRFDLYYTGGRLKPYVFQARRPLRPPQFKGGEDAESSTIKAMVDARYNIGYLYWPAAVRVTFN